MRRALHTFALTVALLALTAPVAMAAEGHDGGEGLYGETSDKVVTDAGFIIIAAFPLLVFLLSLLQWSLDKRKANRPEHLAYLKRKDARKRAAKARSARADMRGGW